MKGKAPKEAKAPKTLETKITGESLFNDGVGVVVFMVIVQMLSAGHHDSHGETGPVILFVKEAVGGIVFGLIIGWVFYRLLKSIENYSLEILYLYNEYIETRWGNIECMVFRPRMQEGRIFQDGEQMKVWISNDKNHLLMKVETKIWAGTVKAFLTDYSSLKNPLSITKKRKDLKIKLAK